MEATEDFDTKIRLIRKKVTGLNEIERTESRPSNPSIVLIACLDIWLNFPQMRTEGESPVLAAIREGMDASKGRPESDKPAAAGDDSNYVQELYQMQGALDRVVDSDKGKTKVQAQTQAKSAHSPLHPHRAESDSDDEDEGDSESSDEKADVAGRNESEPKPEKEQQKEAIPGYRELEEKYDRELQCLFCLWPFPLHFSAYAKIGHMAMCKNGVGLKDIRDYRRGANKGKSVAVRYGSSRICRYCHTTLPALAKNRTNHLVGCIFHFEKALEGQRMSGIGQRLVGQGGGANSL